MKTEGRLRLSLLPFLFIGPAVAWVACLMFFPLAWTFWVSFTKTVMTEQSSELVGPFIGFTNYYELIFNDPDFPIILLNSLIWTLGNVAISGALGLIIALILNEKFPGQSGMRALMLTPWVIPSVATTISWKFMLNSDVGVIQKILVALGLIPEPIAFFGLDYGMFTVIFVNAWRFTPFVALSYISALESIPKDLYEAAEVDGASSFRRFRSITLPFLQPTLAVIGLIGVLLTYGYFDVVWLTTKGGPGTATMIPPVYVWVSSFYEFSLSKGASISVIMAIILLAFALLYRKFILK
jgi:multiple sugar transport system permease protein